MKWFKHFSNSRRDIFIQELMAEFGHKGYAVWFMLIEIIAEDSNRDLSGHITISEKLLAKELGLKSVGLRNILSFCHEQTKFSVTYENNKVIINFPKIKDIKDNYTKDLQATNKRLAPYKDKDKDKEEEKIREPASLVVGNGKIVKKPKPQPKPTEQGLSLTNYFLEQLQKTYPRTKPNINTWACDFDVMLRNGKNYDDLIKVIDYNHKDPFWVTVVKSPTKVNKRYNDTLDEIDNKSKPSQTRRVIN